MRVVLSLTLIIAAAGAVWAQAPSEPDRAKVEELYRQNCQMCHMPDGNAALEQMNFADGKWLHGSEVEDLVKVIKEGVPGTAMMPFKDRLTDEQIDSLARYVRTFDKNLKPADTPASASR